MTTLSFTLSQIHEIEWLPGEDSCVVTYLDAARGRHVQTVEIAELDVLRPSFKRFLSCAASCKTQGGVTGESMATAIKLWDSVLNGRPDRDFMLTDWALRDWSEMVRFDLNTATPECQKLTTRPACHLNFSSVLPGADWVETDILNANIPGVVDACVIMICEYNIIPTEAFNVYLELSKQLSFDAMAAAALEFTQTIRSYLSMDLPISGLGSVLLANLGGQLSCESLPVLMFSQESGLC